MDLSKPGIMFSDFMGIGGHLASEFKVRRARLSDAAAIAHFVNEAQSGRSSGPELTRLSVAERFGQIGFILAESPAGLVGLLGWQVENLVVRVTDYLVASSMVDPLAVGRSMVSKMEDAAGELQAEAVLLFLPAAPSAQLVAFWEGLGYEFSCVDGLRKACRDAVAEAGLHTQNVMSKFLREDAVQRPM